MGFLDGMFSSLTGGQGNGQQNGSNLMDGILTSLTGQTSQQMKEAMEREKPGSICIKNCTKTGEECEKCLRNQNIFLASMTELQNLEKAIGDFNSSPQTAAVPKPSKCSLCGAPIEKGERACPYCDTPYPADASVPDIPQSKPEQEQLLLNKATETYKLYSDWLIEWNSKNMPNTSGGIFGSIMQKMGSAINGALTMNSAQLRQGAQYYELSSYSDYISGIITGQYKTFGHIQLQQYNAAMDEKLKQDQEYRRQCREIDAQAREKSRAIQQEKYQRQLNMTASRTTHYSGGADRSCYNCSYYSAAAGKCAQKGWDTNAGDYCALWKLK